jgi:hypothetical protein
MPQADVVAFSQRAAGGRNGTTLTCLSSGGNYRRRTKGMTRGCLGLFGFVCATLQYPLVSSTSHSPAIYHAPARCLCAACSRRYVCCCPRGFRSRRARCSFHRRSHVARSPFYSETLPSAANGRSYAYTLFYFSPRRLKPRSWSNSPKTGQNAGLPQRQLRRPPSAARHSHTSASGRSKNHHPTRPSLARRVSSRRPKPPTTAFPPLSHNLLTFLKSPS